MRLDPCFRKILFTGMIFEGGTLRCGDGDMVEVQQGDYIRRVRVIVCEKQISCRPIIRQM